VLFRSVRFPACVPHNCLVFLDHRLVEEHDRILCLLNRFRAQPILHPGDHDCSSRGFHGREACARRSRVHHSHFWHRPISRTCCCRMDQGLNRNLRRGLYPFSNHLTPWGRRLLAASKKDIDIKEWRVPARKLAQLIINLALLIDTFRYGQQLVRPLRF